MMEGSRRSLLLGNRGFGARIYAHRKIMKGRGQFSDQSFLPSQTTFCLFVRNRKWMEHS
jgi:hypothetical protein